MQPDEETLSAIANLKGDPRWEKFMTWVHLGRDYRIKALGDEQTVFNAGRVAELTYLIEKIETAREKLEAIKASRALDQTR